MTLTPKRKILLCLVLVLAAVIGLAGLPPEKQKPELLATGIIGCSRQEVAVSIARTLSARIGNTLDVGNFAERNGCRLIAAGTYVIPIEEEAGHAKVTKVDVSGSELYLLGLPRPTSQERLDAAWTDLKRAVHGQ